MSLSARLSDLGETLPDAAAPAANYVPFYRSGDLLFVSGQIPLRDGAFVTGKLGETCTTDEGAAAAKLCALALLAQLGAAIDDDLGRLQQVVKLTGFVNSTPDFGDQPKVINGASDFMVEVLGDKGRHTRSAVGVASLPFGVAVEIEAIFRIS